MPRVCGRPIYYDECRPNLYPLNLPLGLCTVECRAGACCLAGDWDGRWWFLVPWYVYSISVWVYEASRVARSALHTGSERTDAHDEVDDELPPMKHARCNTCCVKGDIGEPLLFDKLGVERTTSGGLVGLHGAVS